MSYKNDSNQDYSTMILVFVLVFAMFFMIKASVDMWGM